MDPDFEGEDDESRSSLPSVLVEPEVPDPFIVDDGEDSDSTGEHDSDAAGEADDNQAADEDIALAQSAILDAPVSASVQQPPLSPNVNKAVPPPPSSSSTDEEEEEEPPELYLPGLIIPTLFLPIPNVPRFLLYFPVIFTTLHRQIR